MNKKLLSLTSVNNIDINLNLKDIFNSIKKNKEYFEEKSYIKSSPLTDEQKDFLSNSEVGETKLVGKGLLSFMNKN